MFKTLMCAVVAVCGTLASGAANAQDFNAMNDAFNAQQNAGMQATTNNIVQTHMNDPHVYQMYQIYLSQGGRLNYESYCFRYAETGGFTQEGFRRATNNSWAIHNQDYKNRQDYYNYSEGLRKDTNGYRGQVHDKWAKERGENLSGKSPYTSTSDGSTWQLPNNTSPGTLIVDQSTGTHFWTDAQGQYWMNQGNGWSSMNYQK